MKGFDRKLPSRPRHLSLAHVGRCSSVVTLDAWFAAVSPVNPEINLLSLTIFAQEGFS